MDTGGTVFDMESDAELKAAVEALAADPTQSGSIHARAMLAYVFGEAIKETLIDPYTIQGRYAQYQEPAASPADAYGLTNYPNPFTDQTVITAQVNQPAYIRVYDLLGREIRRMALEPGNNTLKFSATELEPGLYGYSLYIQGKPVATKIMLHY